MNSLKLGRGFSLIELLVVLVIIAVLAAVAVPAIEALFDPKEELREQAREVSGLMYEARNFAIAGRKRVWIEVNSGERMVSIVRGARYTEMMLSAGGEDDSGDAGGSGSDSDDELVVIKSVFCKVASSVEGFYADAAPVEFEDDTDLAKREEEEARTQAEREVTVHSEESSFVFSFSRFGTAGGAAVRLTSALGSFDITTDFLTGKPDIKFNNKVSDSGGGNE